MIGYTHECGCPIGVAPRWDGLSSYLSFYDGRSDSAGEAINHCPLCDGPLSPDSLCEDPGALQRLAEQIAGWLRAWPAAFTRAMHR